MSEYVIDNRYRCSLYHATCVTVCNSLLFITAHQREGNVFIQVCLSTGGSNMTIIQDALDHPPLPPPPDMGPHWTGTPPPPDMDLTGQGPPTSDIWWPSLETCSNLFTSGLPPTSAYIWWPLKYVRSALVSRRYASYWNAFLFYSVTTAYFLKMSFSEILIDVTRVTR